MCFHIVCENVPLKEWCWTADHALCSTVVQIRAPCASPLRKHDGMNYAVSALLSDESDDYRRGSAGSPGRRAVVWAVAPSGEPTRIPVAPVRSGRAGPDSGHRTGTAPWATDQAGSDGLGSVISPAPMTRRAQRHCVSQWPRTRMRRGTRRACSGRMAIRLECSRPGIPG